MARWLSERGVAAFVLRYRLAREKGSHYKIAEHALQDGQRAVRLVRSRAKEWGVNPARVGMMGFSAGGEVVALVCRNPDKGKEGADDPVERESGRPDFQALVYSGPQGIVRRTITKETPPTFIVVGDLHHSWFSFSCFNTVSGKRHPPSSCKLVISSLLCNPVAWLGEAEWLLKCWGPSALA